MYGEPVEKAWVGGGGGGRSKCCCCRCIWLSGQGIIEQGQDIRIFQNMQKFCILSCFEFLSTSTGCSLNKKCVVSQVLSKIGSTNYSTNVQAFTSFGFDQRLNPRWELGPAICFTSWPVPLWVSFERKTLIFFYFLLDFSDQGLNPR